MRVLVRADGSSTIGIGHLVRCLALAQALRDGGDDVTLVSAADPGALAGRWVAEGAAVRLVEEQIGSAADAQVTRDVAQEVGAAWVVVDGYRFDAAYRVAVRDGLRLAVIDDHGVAGPHADLVVNGNFYAAETLYPDARARLLVGARYALLRRAFRRRGPAVQAAGIVLSLGGADPDGRTLPVLRALSARGTVGRVVIGPRHASPEAIRQAAAALGWQVVEPATEMHAVLASATIAVVGAGTTTLECACLGIPMVAVRIADNQALVAAALADLGLAEARDGSDPEGVAAAVAALEEDPPRLSRMAALGPRLVDGRGAVRVAGAMREALLTLRRAKREDARRLLDWRNDAATRAASFDPAEVTLERHLAWLESALADPDRALLIGQVADGDPFGVVRLNRAGAVATMSVTVAPEARNRALAAPLIRAGLAAAGDLGIKRVDAFIKPENAASVRAFAAAGFADMPREETRHAPPTAVRMTASPPPRR